MPAAQELERLVVRLLMDAKQFNRELSGVTGMMDRSALRMGSAGRAMSLGVTAPLAAIGAVSVREFAKFDDAMTKSTAIMTDVTEDLREEMEETARLISTQSVTSASELAEGYFFLASAGKTAEQSIALLAVTEKFAVAGAFDMALATDLLTDAQSALGLSSRDAATDMLNMSRVADVLVKANTLANATVEQFSVSLTTKAGASLKAYNKDIEEGVAVLAAYADQGVKGQLAGNQLDRVLRLLSKSAMDNADAHKQMGFEVFDANGEMRNMGDIVGNLESVLSGMSTETKVATLDMLGFEARVQQAILPLLGTSDAIKRYESELRNAGGTTQSVANKQLKSFTNQLKIIKNVVIDLAIDIGTLLAPGVLRMANRIKELVTWIKGLNTEQKNWLIAIAKLLAFMGPTLIILSKLTLVVSSLLPLVNGLATAIFRVVSSGRALAVLGAIFNPWVLGIAAVTAAIGGLLFFFVGPEGLVAGWNWAKNAAQTFFDSVIGFAQNFRGNMQAIHDWWSGNWRQILSALTKNFATVFLNMAQNAWAGLQLVSRLYAVWIGWLAGRLHELWQYIWSDDFRAAVIDGILKIMPLLTGLAQGITSVFLGMLAASHEIAKGMANGLIKTLAQVPTALWNILTGIASNLPGVITGLITGTLDMEEALRTLSLDVAAEAVKMAGIVGEEVQKAAVAAQATFIEFAGEAGEAIKAGADQLGEDALDGFTNNDLAGSVRKVWDDVKGEFVNPLEGTESKVGLPELRFDRNETRKAEESVNKQMEDILKMANGDSGVPDVAFTPPSLDFAGVENDFMEAKNNLNTDVDVRFQAVDLDVVEAGSTAALQRIMQHQQQVQAEAAKLAPARDAGGDRENVVAVASTPLPRTPDTHKARVEALLTTIAANTEPVDDDELREAPPFIR